MLVLFSFVIFVFGLNSSYNICEFNFYLPIVILTCGVLVPDVGKFIARFPLCYASLKRYFGPNQMFLEVGHAPVEPVRRNDMCVVRHEDRCVCPLVFLDKSSLDVEVLRRHDGVVMGWLLVGTVKETHDDSPNVLRQFVSGHFFGVIVFLALCGCCCVGFNAFDSIFSECSFFDSCMLNAAQQPIYWITFRRSSCGKGALLTTCKDNWVDSPVSNIPYTTGEGEGKGGGVFMGTGAWVLKACAAVCSVTIMMPINFAIIMRGCFLLCMRLWIINETRTIFLYPSSYPYY